MERNKAKALLAKTGAYVLALLVWELAAALMDNRLLLVGPFRVLIRLTQLCREEAFWRAIGFTFSRITLGFCLAFCLSALLAIVSARFPLAETLLQQNSPSLVQRQ